MCMSEHEKYEQVGRLAEEYSRLKGELNHVNEKANRCQQAYQFAGQAFPHITVVDGKLVVTNPQLTRNFQPQGAELAALLSAHELSELLTERERLNREVKETGDRLRALAPHLL
jgi:hypothetical protein